MPTAADQVSVDTMLADAIAKMDALTKRMDALEVGEKKIIKGDDDDDAKKSKRDDTGKAAKSDDDDDDDRSKKDGITAPKNKILDDAKTASADATGAADSTVKSDKKKSDDGELEIKHGKEKSDSQKKGDTARAKSDDDDDKKSDDDDDDKKGDAFPPPKPGKAKDDAVKDDAVELRKAIADQAATIQRLEAMLKPKSDDEHAAFADAQARADAIFAGFGERAPRPLEGEHLMDYRKRLATRLKKHSPTWREVKFSDLPEPAFKIAEDTVYNDAAVAAANPVDLEAGELRMVTKVDPTTGVRSNVFYGKESFVKGMGRPGRRVASFRTMAST